MVKKTLLSLAIAATAAGLAGCNVSSTDKYENDIDNTPVLSGQPGFSTGSVTPQFQPTRSADFGGPLVPLATDIVFGINSQLKDGDPGKDGTADIDDTTPPVTTALNKLDGFSTTASLYTEFTGALDPDSVVAGKTVFLIKLKNAEEDAGIDALDLTTQPANPVSANQPVAGVDYEARYITLDDGRNHAIQVLPKKPLDPKTKYVLAFTTGIQTAGGQPITASGDTLLIRSNQAVPPALTPLRALVKAWDGIASAATGMSIDGLALTYAFTTGGGADVLHAMAAPGTFLEAKVKAQLPTVDAAEAALSAALGDSAEATLDFIAAQVVAGANLSGIDRDGVKATPALAAAYYGALIQQVTKAQAAPVATAIDAPKSRTFAPLMKDATDPVEVSYDAFLTAQITQKVTDLIIETTTLENPTTLQKIGAAEGIITASAGAAAEATINGIALATAQAIYEEESDTVPETNGGADARTLFKSEAGAALAGSYLTGLTTGIVTAQVADLSSRGTIYQGGLQIPNYLPEAEAGKADNELGNWVASDDAAQALGLAGAPRDKDGSTNVTYRFPFAKKLGDNVIPVFATLPATSKCGPKPDGGWPVAIYQHGITVDRTAGVLVGNALAKACVAMVAIDHAMHGVGPTSATGLFFNVNTLAAGAIDGNGAPTAEATKSPFAVARAGAAGGNDFFANLKERHNNVGKNTAQENVTMAFAAAGAAADVGASGDLYINLQDFARTRDGMRQTVLDLMNLAASIDNMDINADGAADDLDPANLYFIGHSLGGIIGTTFVAVNNDPKVQAYSGKSATNPTGVPAVKAAVLGNAGGGVVKLLENSPGIGALKILPGLKAKAGLEQGSANLEKFFGVFQATVDSADPINFAGASHMQTLPILSYTAVNDAVVPNNALGEVEYSVGVVNGALTVTGATPGAAKTAKSYLSGTDPLVAALGITAVVDSTVTAGSQPGTRFSIRTAADKSDHSTFSSADPQATFAEIFGQIGSFLSPYTPLGAPLNGIAVQDKSVLEQVAE